MRLVGYFAVMAAPGCFALALSLFGVRGMEEWSHLVGLFGFSSMVVTTLVGIVVVVADKIWASPLTLRLRMLLAVACGASAALLWAAASLAYSSSIPGDGGGPFLLFLPIPLAPAWVLADRSHRATRT
jgi:hypothetical protein